MDTRNQHQQPQLNQADTQQQKDYIDMDVVMSSPSPPQGRDFEFQMLSTVSSSNHFKEPSSPSPADELFYKGNLLPLHLPRRLQMVRKILENSANSAPPTTVTTPTLQSCRVSCELNPDEYFFNWTTDKLSSEKQKQQQQQQQHQNSCFSKKLRFVKQSSVISQKLKGSRSYFKSLFGKPACSSDESAAHDERTGSVSKIKDFLNNHKKDYVKVAKQNDPFQDTVSHRRSFSGAIKRHCSAKCMSLSSSSSNSSSNSSSFSVKSSGFVELNMLNRSSSNTDSETERAIEGAIAHCKKSQQRQCAARQKVQNDLPSCLQLQQQQQQQRYPVWIPSLTRSRSREKLTGCRDHGNQDLCRI